MKRTFTYLLLLVLLVCGKQAYNLLISNESIRSNPTGALSDIADEVIAIPLQDSGTHSIKEAKYIRQEGDNLFLISNETLYRFNRKGEFICRITHPDDIRVAGYVVNPANQQLIVLGNTDDIFYYSFNGDLLTRKKLKCDLPENRHMLSISMHNNRIFTTEECVHGDTAGKTATIEKQIVEYDSSFHKLQSHTIRPVDLERSACPIGCLAPEVCVLKGYMFRRRCSLLPRCDHLHAQGSGIHRLLLPRRRQLPVPQRRPPMLRSSSQIHPRSGLSACRRYFLRL